MTLVSLTSSPVAAAQIGEWRAYSADAAGTKYTPLDQITADNAGDLRVVWRQSTIPYAIRQGSTVRAPALVQNTPLMADGRLYVSTALGTVAALDATTGEVVWFDPLPEGVTRRGSATRGVAYWRGPDGDDARIIAVVGSTLVALNARTGARYPDFGVEGEVDLTQGYDTRPVTGFGWRSAPLVVNDVVIVGSAITDVTNGEMLARKEMPPGDVRGFDVRTGEQLWIFHTVPQEGEVGNETWLTRLDEQQASWEYTGNTNMWAWPSADEELGYVYLPLSTPTNDYYGGHRPGDNLFAESIVAVDIETGQRMWHFQAVHHGVWDYDFPAAPNLIDITVDGRRIKAIAQVSKQGFTYVLDRMTGDPVWPIEERPVETDTDLDGEVLSPTQPFPTKPAPFEYQGMSIDDLVDFTPEIRTMAVAAVNDFRLGPLFTPPTMSAEGGMQGTIQRPHIRGAASWTGAAVDPDTGLLYVPSVNGVSVLKYYTPDAAQGGNLRLTQSGFGSGVQPDMPDGLPLLKPPYSRITAIDLNEGEHQWMQPAGDGNRFRDHELLSHLDLPPLGDEGVINGPVLTKTLLVSALSTGGTDDGPRLVARDKATGDVVGWVDLPARAIGTPMTYLHEGVQYIALTVGGAIPELVAFRLPS